MIAAAGHVLADAGAFALFGTLLFRSAIDPAPSRLLVRAALGLALGGAVLWLFGQAADFEAGVMEVLSGTWFGRVLAVQCALFALAAAAGGWGGTVLAGVGVGLGAARGHGVAMGDAPALVACAALHLLAAAAWLGALPALLLAVRAGRDGAAARFSRLGMVSVSVLAASAAWQGWILGGGVPGLIGTGYGAMLAGKTAGFLVLILFAARHRFMLVPALPGTRLALARSLIGQGATGLLVLVLAVLLGGMTPGMHDQPWWPFAWRFDGYAFGDDDLRAEVLTGLAWCGAGFGLLLAGVWRRWLWLAAPVAFWLGIPHLDLLFVPAYPTSFWVEPEAPSEASVAAGEALFAAHCVACHGAGGAGDGPLARTLPVPPADLTAAHLWEHSDGELFWWISAGMTGMPGFAGTVDEAGRWALIDAIRARNPFRPAAGAAPAGHHHHM